MVSGGRPDSLGGGVVAEIFRDRRKPGRFSGGGGGSSRIYFASPISVSQPHSVGSGRFLFFWVTGGQDQSNYLNSGNFFGHFRVTSRLPEINCRKKTFNKSLGGAMAPWPPPGYATGYVTGHS